MGADTWGVDWALVTEQGDLLGLPHAYRDPRNPGYYEQALKITSREEIYHATGIQLMPINSLFSVYAATQETPDLFAKAHRLLFIPDLIHFGFPETWSLSKPLHRRVKCLIVFRGHGHSTF
ncbi:MAG: hypothetical protein R3C03_17345 [Pirellulaceae bacterium]